MDERKVYEHLHIPSWFGGITGGSHETDDSGDDGSVEPNSYTPTTYYSADELSSMKASEIRKLAEDRGYSLKARKKADLIDGFMEQQG